METLGKGKRKGGTGSSQWWVGLVGVEKSERSDCVGPGGERGELES